MARLLILAERVDTNLQVMSDAIARLHSYSIGDSTGDLPLR
jgi:hypothetical protein